MTNTDYRYSILKNYNFILNIYALKNSTDTANCKPLCLISTLPEFHNANLMIICYSERNILTA